MSAFMTCIDFVFDLFIQFFNLMFSHWLSGLIFFILLFALIIFSLFKRTYNGE